MASKRKMVFGYRMELGDIVPSPNEAETVRYIYGPVDKVARRSFLW